MADTEALTFEKVWAMFQETRKLARCYVTLYLDILFYIVRVEADKWK